MYPRASSNHATNGDGESHSQQTTPPLVFTTQFTSSARTQMDSPALEPLQMANYNAVIGGYDSSLNSPVIPRRASSTQLQVEDSPIRVTCRTRDGRRSPVVAQPVGDVLMEPEAVRGNPYGYSFSGRTSPIQACSPVGSAPTPPFPDAKQSKEPIPSAPEGNAAAAADTDRSGVAEVVPDGRKNGSQTASLMQPLDELPQGVVHRSLHGRCRFVAFPASLSSPDGNNGAAATLGGKGKHSNSSASLSSDGQSLMALFIGQVRFETTPAELIWLIHRTSGACASHVEGRGAGCYLLYCKSEADLQLVRSLHKRLLFDVRGVWLARTAEEVDALCEYVALDAPLLSRKAHLPRDSMVVEELKPDAHSHHMSTGRFSHGVANSPPPPPPHYNGGGGRQLPLPPPSFPHHLSPQPQQGFPPMYSAGPPFGAPVVGMYGLPPYETAPGVVGSASLRQSGAPPPPPLPPPPYR